MPPTPSSPCARTGADGEDRRASLAYASQIMRSVIINSIREQMTGKRRADRQPVELSGSAELGLAGDEHAILEMHDAMERLSCEHPRLARVAQMRYFGGFTEAESGDGPGARCHRTNSCPRLAKGAQLPFLKPYWARLMQRLIKSLAFLAYRRREKWPLPHPAALILKKRFAGGQPVD
jgi:ECF sigma factor